MPPENEMSPENETPVLRFDHVTVVFDDAPALDDVSFDAYAGESRVILGAAGSGKTVLLKTALGLVKPQSGKVFAFGRDLTTLSEAELFEIRSKMGMLFQEGALFDSLTIEENVAYPLLNQKSIQCPPEEVHPRVVQALEFVELGQTLEKFPSELSGGMRRRAAIARAVVTEPPLSSTIRPPPGSTPLPLTPSWPCSLKSATPRVPPR
jgi:phospholipid/cholesterol/gamma-HCH transport system ATP-binding protein